LSAEEPRRGHCFAITLRNVGQVPLIVDRELVFGLAVEAFGPGDEGPINLDVVRVLPRPTPAELARRFVRLEPGEEVRRNVDLTDGFAAFRWYIDHKGEESSALQDYEHLVRLPLPAKLRKVKVTYDPYENIPPGVLAAYTDGKLHDVVDSLAFWPPAVSAELAF
jgi:hypothetical protein